jgi:alkylation response protein AidB-like acyl-CoA dehydrogenase
MLDQDVQDMLLESLDGLLRRHWSWEQRQETVASPAVWDADLWKILAVEQGIITALIPERAGGLGGDPATAVRIAETFGRNLFASPFLEGVLLTAAMIARADGPLDEGLWSRLADGSARVAITATERFRDGAALDCKRDPETQDYVLTGCHQTVIGAASATHLIVPMWTDEQDGEERTLHLLVTEPADTLSMDEFVTNDDYPAADLHFLGHRIPASAVIASGARAVRLYETAIDCATLGLCGEAVGVCNYLLEQTATYLSQRVQFGQPLARFQTLRHRLVDMKVHIEKAMTLALAAARIDPASVEEFSAAVSAAKIASCQMLRFVGENAVHLHGGMGMTDELPVGHYFKRAVAMESQFGSFDDHSARYEAISFW